MDKKKKHWLLSQLFSGNKTPIQQAKDQAVLTPKYDFSQLSDEELNRLIYGGMDEEEFRQLVETSDASFIKVRHQLCANVNPATLSDEELDQIVYAGMSSEDISRHRESFDKAYEYMTDEELNAIIEGKLTDRELATLVSKATYRCRNSKLPM